MMRKTITLSYNPEDSIVKSDPVQSAVEQLRDTLSNRGYSLTNDQNPEKSSAGWIVVGSKKDSKINDLLLASGIEPPRGPESYCLRSVCGDGRYKLVVYGADPRGLAYALYEVSEQIACKKLEEVLNTQNLKVQPANRVRSIMRAFVSEMNDKEWYYSRHFWRDYLSMLIRNHFNRFSLMITGSEWFGGRPPSPEDAYFFFPFPFLIRLENHLGQVKGLSEKERSKNLKFLQHISSRASKLGLDFFLGIWNFSPRPQNGSSYTIRGINSGNHAEYCRDALVKLLNLCPSIRGLTLRINWESGLREGNYDFWSTVFDGIADCGQDIQLDMRAKGIDRQLIELARNKGLDFSISTKYTAELMGLPYHQAGIRELERTGGDSNTQIAKMHRENLFSADDEQEEIENISRHFTRYGYADLLSEDRDYDFFFRLWPATQKVLLWGDPGLTAAFSRFAGFCGSSGLEVCEPMTFRGHADVDKDSGRTPYLNEKLKPSPWAYKKYRYTYKLWGRLLYNPECDPEIWRRGLRCEFGASAPAVEKALGRASNVLPFITSAHLPSANSKVYWPEMYTNMPMADSGSKHPYEDTCSPKTFHNVSPLDPVLFYSMDEYAQDILEQKVSGKVTPIEAAEHLLMLAESSEKSLAQTSSLVDKPYFSGFSRLEIDVSVLIGLARFFAYKFKAGTYYALYRNNADYFPLYMAISAYKKALGFWDEIIQLTDGVYKPNLVFGPKERGECQRRHWKDRREAIASDIWTLEKEKDRLVKLRDSSKPAIYHTPPIEKDWSGEIAVSVGGGLEETPLYLHYRHPSQETFRSVSMVQSSESPLILRAKIQFDREKLEGGNLEYYISTEMSAENGNLRFPEQDYLRPPYTIDRENKLRKRVSHSPPPHFLPGKDLELTLTLDVPPADDTITVILHYRHVNQAEKYQHISLKCSDDSSLDFVIPGEYTDTIFPLIYFFEVRYDQGAFMLPGFNAFFHNQPYYVIHQR